MRDASTRVIESVTALLIDAESVTVHLCCSWAVRVSRSRIRQRRSFDAMSADDSKAASVEAPAEDQDTPGAIPTLAELSQKAVEATTKYCPPKASTLGVWH